MHVIILFTVIGAFPFLSVEGTCPYPWKQFEDTCYLFVNYFVCWHHAIEWCESEDAHLVIIRNKAEQKFIQENGRTNERYWIGLNDLREEDDWHWVDESELSGYTNWNNGEPNNDGDRENCVHVYLYQAIMGEWNDATCDTLMHYICQRKDTR